MPDRLPLHPEIDLTGAPDVEYSVVVPVYGSDRSLVELTDQLRDFFENEARAAFEIVFVDDASPNPETWPTLVGLHDRDARVKAVRLSRNFGQQPATLCGLGYTRGRWVITMDDDLQHAPAEIAKLIAAREHDVAVAQFPSRRQGPLRGITSRLKQWFDHRVLERPKGLHLSSFRLMSRAVVDDILRIDTAHPFIGSMIFMVTGDVVGVPVENRPRTLGKSGYSFRRMVRLFFDLVVNNSTFLLNVVGVIGLVFSALSLTVGIVVVAKKLAYGVPIMGWTSLMAMISFLGGMSLLAISIIGQYLIRIIHEVQGKPAYTAHRVRY